MGVFGAFFGCIGDGGFNGCWSGACSGVVGFKVPMGGVPCAKKFALLDLMVCVSAKQFAQRTKNGRKSVVCSVLGEVFRGNAGGRAVLGEFFRANRCCAQVLDAARRISGWLWWGICSIRSWLAGYLRRVAALMMQFPPVWWRRSRESRGCGRQSADPLGEKSPKTTVSGEWVYDLAESIAVVVCCSRVTPRTCLSISCCAQLSM